MSDLHNPETWEKRRAAATKRATPEEVAEWKKGVEGPLLNDEDYDYPAFVAAGGRMDDDQLPHSFLKPGRAAEDGRDMATGELISEDGYTGPLTRPGTVPYAELTSVMNWANKLKPAEAAVKAVARGGMEAAEVASNLPADAMEYVGGKLSEYGAAGIEKVTGSEILGELGGAVLQTSSDTIEDTMRPPEDAFPDTPYVYKDGLGLILEQLATGLSQFAIPYAGATKGARFKELGSWLQRLPAETGAGALVSAAVFDPDEGNLSAWLDDLGILPEEMEALATSEDSTALENRIRTGIEDAVLGPVFEGAIRSVKYGKDLLAKATVKAVENLRAPTGGTMLDKQRGAVGNLAVARPGALQKLDTDPFTDRKVSYGPPTEPAVTGPWKKWTEDYPETMQWLSDNLTSEEKNMLSVAFVKRIDDLRKRGDTGEMASTPEVMAMARAGEAKRGWYVGSGQAIKAVFGKDAARFTQLLAATSPQTSVQSNLRNALNVWSGYLAIRKEGRAITREDVVRLMGDSVEGDKGVDSVLDAWVNNSVRALTAADSELKTLRLSGPKVDSFWQNLAGNLDELTNDAWQKKAVGADKAFSGGAAGKAKGKILGVDEKLGVKNADYLATNARMREAAEALTEQTGEVWTPAEVQETVWSFVKALWEKREGAGPDTMFTVLGDLTDAEINSVPDFRSLFNEGDYKRILENAGYGQQLTSIGQDAGTKARGALALDEIGQLEQSSRRLEHQYRQGETRARLKKIHDSIGADGVGPVRVGDHGVLTGELNGMQGRSLALDEASAGKLNEIGVSTPPVYSLGGPRGATTPAMASKFKAAVLASKSGGKYGAAVHVYTAKEYRGMRLFMTEDGTAGFALKGDDIVSVYNNKSGPHSAITPHLLTLAVQQGGRKLDAFDTVLPRLYSLAGFQPVSRVPWDDAQAPKGWDKEAFARFNGGEPDVVMMVFDPTFDKEKLALLGPERYTKQGARGKQLMDYGSAVEAQAAAARGDK